MRSFPLATLALCATLACASHLEPRDVVDIDPLEERDWFDVDVGLMIERQVDPTDNQTLSRRAHPLTRDLIDRQPVTFYYEDVQSSGDVTARDVSGPRLVKRRMNHQKLKLLRRKKAARARAAKKRAERKKKDGHKEKNKSVTKQINSTVNKALGAVTSSFSGIITYYTGHDLLGPSCVTHSKWHPTDQSFAAALTIDWPGKPKCGDYLHLRQKGGSKAIVVRVVDSCGGCKAKSKHVDLTKAAFSSLYALNIGEVSGIQVSVLKNDPNGSHYSKSAIAKYGPKTL